MARNRFRAFVAAASILLGVFGGVSRAATDLSIRVLSNRADLVSDGDALVEIAGPGASSASVDLNGTDVTSSFAERGNGRVMGLLTGLAVGQNVLTAMQSNGHGARLVITNHLVGGPVFSGPQLQPWVCTTASNGLGAPTDAQCNAPTKIEYFYQATGSTSFAPYDPAHPAANVATIKTDQGKSVPYIIRQETGTQNRGIYRLAVLFDPSKAWDPWAPQDGWNQKLYYPFGASCGTAYTQGSAQGVQNANALSRGFMVATSSLNVLGNACNTVLSAESMMMLKEHIVDRYGEVRYTFGTGGSGGSIGQNMVANAYPGLLQGITETQVFEDTTTTGVEVFDCHLLVQYIAARQGLWTPQEFAFVTGHGSSLATCAGWEEFFAAVENPRDGAGVPADQAYDPQTNPGGARGRYEDFERNVWGLRPKSLWIAPEKAVGHGFAKGLFDNTGVQYGLTALKQGLITTEQFVDLNEKIGCFDVDFNLVPNRCVADPGTSFIAYQAARVDDARQLDQVAILDERSTGNVDPLTIHTMHHSFALKDRLRKAHGTAANHAVWRGGEPDTQFNVMDRWLGAVEADTSAGSLATKIIRDKPAEARDMCFLNGQFVSSNKATCDVVWPYYGAPRIVAGGPTTNDVLKCQLKPLDRDSADYGPIPFTDAQWARIAAVFGSTGVCDFSKRGVGQFKSVPWMTYTDGPGRGHALPAVPVSVAF